LIEVEPADGGPATLVVRAGDVLLIRASGCHVRDGESVVEVWGPLVGAVVGRTGEVMTPAGPPNAVLVHARQPGTATLDLFTGDLWHGPRQTMLHLIIEL
jgi:hypothetical protein